LAQVGTGSLPAAVATLNVTEKLKIGKNSLYLGPTIPTATDNSIYSDGSDLLLQSSSNVFNTVINANNAGKVGIGTTDPKEKLDIAGRVRISNSSWSAQRQPGLELYFDGAANEGSEITSIFKTSLGLSPEFSPLTITAAPIIMISQTGKSTSPIAPIRLTGSPIILNGDYQTTQKVSIGTAKNVNMLDIAGSVAIGSGYAGTKTVSTNGLVVEGSVGIGTATPRAKLDIVGGIRTAKGDPMQGDGANVGYAFDGDGDTGMFAVGGSTVENSDLHFKVDNEIKLVVRDNGNVGIGTTDPQAKLHVDGSWFLLTGGGNALRFTPNNPRPEIGSSSGDISFWHTNSGWNELKARKFTPMSDARLKKEVSTINNALEKVQTLRGVSFKWKDNSRSDIGVIAQEIEPVIPELVSTDGKGYKSVSYDGLTAVLVEAVKELKGQNEALKAIVCKDHPRELICQ